MAGVLTSRRMPLRYIPVRGLDNGAAREALNEFHATRLAEASRDLPVHTYSPHYAPHFAYRDSSNHDGLQPASPLQSAPTFAELLASGTIGAGRSLFLGMGADGPLTGTWKSVYSAGIGGLQGSGKTWTAMSLILQALADGTRVFCIDPHDGDLESLGSRLKPVAHLLARPVASDPRDIPRLLAEVRAELSRRASSKSDDRTPVLLVIDEWTALQRGEMGDEITSTVEAVTQEGRKLAINCLLLGQRWSATRSGGGDLRNTLTSAFVHRMRPEDARMLTGLRAEQLPKDMLTLEPGECYVQTTTGDLVRVKMPRMTDADVGMFAARIASSGASSPAQIAASQAPSGDFGPSSAGSVNGYHDGAAKTVDKQLRDPSSENETAGQGANDPQYEVVRSWIIQGVPYAEIRDRLAGRRVTGGQLFQETNARLTAMLQAIAMEAMFSQGGTSNERED